MRLRAAAFLAVGVLCAWQAPALASPAPVAGAAGRPMGPKDPITGGDGKCHPERTGPGLGVCGYRVGPIVRSFKSCLAFDRWLSTPRPQAVTYYMVTVRSQERIPPDIEIFSFRAVTQIVMPSFQWPHVTAVQRRHLQEVLAALRHHEDGHVTIADQFTNDLAPQKTPDEGQLLKDEQATLVRREVAYDWATINGLEQSKGPSAGFPGGSDVLWAGCS